MKTLPLQSQEELQAHGLKTDQFDQVCASAQRMGVMGGPVPPESTQKLLGQITAAQLHALWNPEEDQEEAQNVEGQNIEDQSTEA